MKTTTIITSSVRIMKVEHRNAPHATVETTEGPIEVKAEYVESMITLQVELFYVGKIDAVKMEQLSKAVMDKLGEVEL